MFPQIPVEEIVLAPHPLDAWRAALNALVSLAPGVSADVAWHLEDARRRLLVIRDFTAASETEALLIDRLLLLGAAKLMGKPVMPAVDVPEPATPIGAEPVDMRALAAAIRLFPGLAAPMDLGATEGWSGVHPGVRHPVPPFAPARRPAAGSPAPVRSVAPQVRSDR